jgi:hypothetical protein
VQGGIFFHHIISVETVHIFGTIDGKLNMLNKICH